MRLGFLGGTGPQGRGLAQRLAAAGHEVVIGSRSAERAADVAAGLPGARGLANADVPAASDAVFVTVPYDGMAATLTPLAASLKGMLVISCVNALGFDARGPFAPVVEAGSAAEEVAALLPGALVTCAFNSVSASHLVDPDHVFDEDVWVCGDDDDAVRRTVALADAIDGMRGVAVGALRLAATVEALTAVLISVNKRHGVAAGVRLTGL